MKGCQFFPLFVAVLKISLATAQFSDDFDDQNLNENPLWLGDTSAFIVNDQMQLQLQAPPDGEVASIFTANEALENSTWQLDVILDFNPSSNNYLDWYLASNQPSDSEQLSGYFVRVGNSEDEISLYRKKGNDVEEIIDGEDDVLDQNQVAISIRVVHENENWTIEYKSIGASSWTSGGSSTDTTFSGSSYSGLMCHYTSTRADKFKFDNLIVSGEARPDNAPMISRIDFPVANQLNCTFDQPVLASLLQPDMIALGAEDIQPTEIDIPDESTLILRFEESLVDQKQYTLAFTSVTSKKLVQKENLSYHFTFEKPYIVQKGDLLITEIMADPTPGNGLPEYEYLEIANISGKAINKQKLLITIKDNTIETPVFNLLPGEHLILAESEAVEEFDMYGKCIAFGLPAIVNDGSVVAISNIENQLLHKVEFEKSWYRDNEKASGGYALELIDTSSVCHEHAGNWIASFEAEGGSPGRPNTASQFYSDTKAPVIQFAEQSSSNGLTIRFDEAVSSFGSVLIQNDLQTDTAFIQNGISDIILVETLDSLPKNQAFQVSVTNPEDCFHNRNKKDSTSLVIPSNLHDDFILWSEILFNAGLSTPEYLELYNNSDAYIDINGWEILVYQDDSSDTKTLFLEQLPPIYPHTFIVVTSDREKLINAFPHALQEYIFEINLPNLWDDYGSVELRNEEGIAIEKLNYSDEMHHYRLEDTDGVALERISWGTDAEDKSNWVSAAYSVQFGTPTLPNSQQVVQKNSEQLFYIEHRSFSPDHDGYRDFLKIDLLLPKSGLTVHAEILDFNGELVQSLAQDATLGPESHLIWDGLRIDGGVASPGNYLLYLEILENGKPLHVNREKIVLYYP